MPPPLRLYSSWFCPYAQRAWIALEIKKAEYEYVEINPYEDPKDGSGATKISKSLKRKAEVRFLSASLNRIGSGSESQADDG